MNHHAIPLMDVESPPPAEPQEQVRELPTFDVSSLFGQTPPEREWLVEGMMPYRSITLLSGDGGTGKTLLALQLAVAVASGGYWIGRTVKSGSVLFVSAEDDKDELHRRIFDVCSQQNVSLLDLPIRVSPLVGVDAILAAPEGKLNILKTTALFRGLEAKIREFQPELVVLDTLADLFGGDENQRSQARQFVGLLRGFCSRHQTTILVLAHPSLGGMARGDGTSGSTAWNNSVRSRLYFKRVKSEVGAEDDPDVRVLKVEKANYGPVGEEIRLRWQAGIFATPSSPDSFKVIASRSGAERVFLTLLAAYEREGRRVTSTTGHGYAPKTFALDQRAEGVSKARLLEAMNGLFAAGKIKTIEEGPPSRRVGHIVIVSTGETE